MSFTRSTSIGRIAPILLLCMIGASTVLAVWPFKSKSDEPSKFVTPPPADARGGSVAAAKGGQGSSNLLRVSHLKFQDAERERGFLELTVSRVRTREDLTVIDRLLAEKRMEVAKFSQQMEKDFGVKADDNYQYEKSERAIFELTPKAAAPGSTNGAPAVDRKLVVKFDNADKEARFVRLATSKRLSTEQIRILRLLDEEKRLEQKTIEQALQKNFNIAPEKNYEYDIDAKTIYELVAVPEGRAGEQVSK